MRTGFCCIHLQPDGKKTPAFKNATATVAHVSKLDEAARATYLRRCADANLEALFGVVRHLANLPLNQRMFRITSELLPLYTHAVAKPVYLDPTYHAELRASLALIGQFARASDVRLSFHPGQFTVLNSAKQHVREASIEDFEHHVRVAHYMGYVGGNNPATLRNGVQHRDSFVINVHCGAGPENLAAGLSSWDWSWRRLSPAARRLITLENDEMSWGAAECLALCEHLGVRMVPDVHHHWVRTGEWLDPASPFVQRMAATWGGLAPKMHVSMPLPDLLPGGYRDTPLFALRTDTSVLPEPALPQRPNGVGLTALRTHSDYLYHPAMVPYLQRWHEHGWDICVEAKAKNLASTALVDSLEILNGHRQGKPRHVSSGGR